MNKNAFSRIRQLSKALAETHDEDERQRIQEEIWDLEDELDDHGHVSDFDDD